MMRTLAMTHGFLRGFFTYEGTVEYSEMGFSRPCGAGGPAVDCGESHSGSSVATFLGPGDGRLPYDYARIISLAVSEKLDEAQTYTGSF